MNKYRQTLFKTLALILCLISSGWVLGQKETKTFKESFKVTNATVLDIDTSHTDIEFETWDKNEIEIEAVVEIEGASIEEIERYFEEDVFEIVGNSKKVEVRTNGRGNWTLFNGQDFHFELPEVPELTALEHFPFELEELAEMPELPEMRVPSFDYEAYTEDKEEYLKEWQLEFEKGLGEDYPKRMKEWGEKMKAKKEVWQKKREKMLKEREEEREERRKKMEEERAKVREKRAEAHEKRRKAMEKRREVLRERNRRNRSFFSTDDEESSIFFFSTDGESRNYKVKKSMKIKMPKGTKIKMDVRHGEVKLANNTLNIKANLSHSSLWANAIDGDKTTIRASYSPVTIERWNLGHLQTDYSENVNLKEVFDIKLNAISSNITIDKIIKTAFVKNDFGPLVIGSISEDFTNLDFTLQNAELDLRKPNVAFDVYVNGTSSTLSAPDDIVLARTKNLDNTVHTGYYLKNHGDKSIVINSKYSEVVIK